MTARRPRASRCRGHRADLQRGHRGSPGDVRDRAADRGGHRVVARGGPPARRRRVGRRGRRLGRRSPLPRPRGLRGSRRVLGLRRASRARPGLRSCGGAGPDRRVRAARPVEARQPRLPRERGLALCRSLELGPARSASTSGALDGERRTSLSALRSGARRVLGATSTRRAWPRPRPCSGAAPDRRMRATRLCGSSSAACFPRERGEPRALPLTRLSRGRRLPAPRAARRRVARRRHRRAAALVVERQSPLAPRQHREDLVAGGLASEHVPYRLRTRPTSR